MPSQTSQEDIPSEIDVIVGQKIVRHNAVNLLIGLIKDGQLDKARTIFGQAKPANLKAWLNSRPYDLFTMLSAIAHYNDLAAFKWALGCGADLYQSALTYSTYQIPQTIACVVANSTSKKYDHGILHFITKKIKEDSEQDPSCYNFFISMFLHAISYLNLPENDWTGEFPPDAETTETVIYSFLEILTNTQLLKNKVFNEKHTVAELALDQARIHNWSRITNLLTQPDTDQVSMEYKKKLLCNVSRDGKHELLAILLGNGISPENAAIKGVPALMLAIINSHLEVVRLLIRFHAEIDYYLRVDAMDEAKNPLSVKTIPITTPDKNGESPLQAAITYGFDKIAMELVNAGAKFYNGYMPIYEICEKGNLNLLKMTITLCRNQNKPIKKSDLEYALCIASQRGHCAILEFLTVEQKININKIKKPSSHIASNATSFTALSLALGNNQEQATVILVQHGATFSTLDFIQACSKGQLALVKAMHQKGADINGEDSNKKSALAYACLSQQVGVIAYFLQQNVTYSLPHPLTDAEPLPPDAAVIFIQTVCAEGKIEFLKIVHDQQLLVDVNLVAAEKTYLQIAIEKGQLAIVALLLDYGAIADEKTMALAAQRIVDAGLLFRIFDTYCLHADPEKKQNYLNNLLLQACQAECITKANISEKLKLVKKLLEAGAHFFAMTTPDSHISPLLYLLDSTHPFNAENIIELLDSIPYHSYQALEEISQIKDDSFLLLFLAIFYKLTKPSSLNDLEVSIQECISFFTHHSIVLAVKNKAEMLIDNIFNRKHNMTLFPLFKNWLDFCSRKKKNGEQKSDKDYITQAKILFETRLAHKSSIFIAFAVAKLSESTTIHTNTTNSIKNMPSYNAFVLKAMELITGTSKKPDENTLNQLRLACQKEKKIKIIDGHLRSFIQTYLFFLYPSKEPKAEEPLPLPVSKTLPAVKEKNSRPKPMMTVQETAPQANTTTDTSALTFDAFTLENVLPVQTKEAGFKVGVQNKNGVFRKSVHCSPNLYVDAAIVIAQSLPEKYLTECYIVGMVASCLATNSFSKFNIHDLDMNIHMPVDELLGAVQTIPDMHIIGITNFSIHKPSWPDHYPEFKKVLPLVTLRLNQLKIQILCGEIIPFHYRDFLATSLLARWEPDNSFTVIDGSGQGVNDFQKRKLRTCHRDSNEIFRKELPMMLRALNKQLQGFKLSRRILVALTENFSQLDLIPPFTLYHFSQSHFSAENSETYTLQDHSLFLNTIKKMASKLILDRGISLDLPEMTEDEIQVLLASIDKLLQEQVEPEDRLHELIRELTKAEPYLGVHRLLKLIHFAASLKIKPDSPVVDLLARKLCLILENYLLHFPRTIFDTTYYEYKNLFIDLWTDLSQYHFRCDKRTHQRLIDKLGEISCLLIHKMSFSWEDFAKLTDALKNIIKSHSLPIAFINSFYESLTLTLLQEQNSETIFSWDKINYLTTFVHFSTKIETSSPAKNQFLKLAWNSLSLMIDEHYTIDNEKMFATTATLLSCLFLNLHSHHKSLYLHLINAINLFLSMPNHQFPLMSITHVWQSLMHEDMKTFSGKYQFVDLLILHTPAVLTAKMHTKDNYFSYIDALEVVLNALDYLNVCTIASKEFLDNLCSSYLNHLQKDSVYFSLRADKAQKVDHLFALTKDLSRRFRDADTHLANHTSTLWQRFQSDLSAGASAVPVEASSSLNPEILSGKFNAVSK